MPQLIQNTEQVLKACDLLYFASIPFTKIQLCTLEMFSIVNLYAVPVYWSVPHMWQPKDWTQGQKDDANVDVIRKLYKEKTYASLKNDFSTQLLGLPMLNKCK